MIRFALAFLLLIQSALAVDSWKVDETACTGARASAAATPTLYWTSFHVAASGVPIRVYPLSGTGAGGATHDSAFNGTVRAFTDTQDFFVVFGQAPLGTLTLQQRYDAMIKMKWISAYKVASSEPQQSTSGPYNGTGDPTLDDGGPADPINETPHIKSYTGSITVTCPTSALSVKNYRVLGKNTSNEIIYQQIILLAPGESRTITVTADEPFTLSAVEVMINIGFDPEKSSGEPSDEKRYRPIGTPSTVNATASTAAGPDGKPVVNDEKTAQAASPALAAASKNTISTATTGATSKDVSDLSNNLSNELQRTTEQVKSSGDSIRASVDEGTKELKKLNEGAGDGSTGSAIPEANAGALGFATGVGTKMMGLTSAVSNLVSAAGLSSDPGTATLTWQFPNFVGGDVTVSLEPMSDTISLFRSVETWLLGVLFLWIAIGIVRGALVDET